MKISLFLPRKPLPNGWTEFSAAWAYTPSSDQIPSILEVSILIFGYRPENVPLIWIISGENFCERV